MEKKSHGFQNSYVKLQLRANLYLKTEKVLLELCITSNIFGTVIYRHVHIHGILKNSDKNPYTFPFKWWEVSRRKFLENKILPEGW